MEKPRPILGKEGVAPEPVEPVRELPPDQVHAEASPTRCPFCHERIALAEEAWVACEGCLARHHEGCWNECGRCASCSATRKLARESASASPPPVAPALWLRHFEDGARAKHLEFGPSLAPLPEKRLPAPAASWAFEKLLGAPRWIEVERELPGVVPESSCGAWTTNELALSVEVALGQTRVRARAGTKNRAGIYAGIMGGIGGGVGGGLSAVIATTFGSMALPFWLVFIFGVTFALARFAFRKTVANDRAILEELVAGLAAELQPRASSKSS